MSLSPSQAWELDAVLDAIQCSDKDAPRLEGLDLPGDNDKIHNQDTEFIDFGSLVHLADDFSVASLGLLSTTKDDASSAFSFAGGDSLVSLLSPRDETIRAKHKPKKDTYELVRLLQRSAVYFRDKSKEEVLYFLRQGLRMGLQPRAPLGGPSKSSFVPAKRVGKPRGPYKKSKMDASTNCSPFKSSSEVICLNAAESKRNPIRSFQQRHLSVREIVDDGMMQKTRDEVHRESTRLSQGAAEQPDRDVARSY